MTSHLDSHGTTDVILDMLSGVQTGNGIQHDKYNLHGIVHVHVYRKEDIFMRRQLSKSFTYIWGQGTKSIEYSLKIEPFNNFYIDEAHTALDIFQHFFYQNFLEPIFFFTKIPRTFLLMSTQAASTE